MWTYHNVYSKGNGRHQQKINKNWLQTNYQRKSEWSPKTAKVYKTVKCHMLTMAKIMEQDSTWSLLLWWHAHHQHHQSPLTNFYCTNIIHDEWRCIPNSMGAENRKLKKHFCNSRFLISALAFHVEGPDYEKTWSLKHGCVGLERVI